LTTSPSLPTVFLPGSWRSLPRCSPAVATATALGPRPTLLIRPFFPPANTPSCFRCALSPLSRNDPVEKSKVEAAAAAWPA
jgi:hypothetical protein